MGKKGGNKRGEVIWQHSGASGPSETSGGSDTHRVDHGGPCSYREERVGEGEGEEARR
jgi:hypothetical protein